MGMPKAEIAKLAIDPLLGNIDSSRSTSGRIPTKK
jgi:hypothetical protein